MEKRHPARDIYKTRISNIIRQLDDSEDLFFENSEMLAHFAKYLSVLISGYIEQSLKDIFFEYAKSKSAPEIISYIEKTWPISRNMKTENIKQILGQFNRTWELEFTEWLDEPKSASINNLIGWRNSIAHGQEQKANAVTLPTIKENFITAKELVCWCEELVLI